MRNEVPTSSPEDQVLIMRAQGGDMDAFRCLYEKYRNNIHAVCLRYTGNFHDAEELSQDVFLTAYTNIEQVNMAAPFSVWLCEITLSLATQLFQENQRPRWSSLEALLKRGTDFATGDNPENVTLRHELLEKVLELPAEQRSAVLLHDLNGLTREECAETLGWTTGRFLHHLFDGRRALRKMFTLSAVPHSLQLVSKKTFAGLTPMRVV